MSGVAVVEEKNEPASTESRGGNERGVASIASTVKFYVRSILCCDCRRTSRAVVEELYEAGFEAPRRIDWNTSSNFRRAGCAGVKKLQGGFVGYSERRSISESRTDSAAGDNIVFACL
ncbi:MAG TPA: hypothetical protein VGG92_17155 [Caulobacteraceae bacterium]